MIKYTYMSKKYKSFSIKYLFTLVIGLAMAIFCFATAHNCMYLSSIKTDEVYAANTPTQPEDPLESISYVNISQEDHRFNKNDFTKITYEDSEVYSTYTNKTVTISQGDATSFAMVSINGLNNFSSYLQTIGTKQYYVFDIGQIEQDTTYQIIFRCSKTITTSTGNVYKSYTFDFHLIQTKTDFNSNSNINWNYTVLQQEFNVNSIASNQTYSTLNLSIPSGSTVNPTYTDFTYMGEKYSISVYKYKDIQNIYHTVVTNEITSEIISETESDTDSVIGYLLKFEKSGDYYVKIYDKTSSVASSMHNVLEYNFNIKNTQSPFYISANTHDNSVIMRGQITNADVFVSFVNIAEVASKISKVDINRSYRPTDNQNVTVTTTYTASQLDAAITFDLDGMYEIKVFDKQGSVSYIFSFTILQSIRSAFTIDGETITTTPEDPVNTPMSRVFTRSVSSNYNDDINTSTSYSFVVTVAKSSPRIDGINNNGRTSGSVNFSVYGVRELSEYATIDGKTIDLGKDIFASGDSLLSFTEKGSYFVKVTDQMGNISTKTFTITIQLNTASMILIGIGIAIVAFLVVFIIISKTRVKVR